MAKVKNRVATVKFTKTVKWDGTPGNDSVIIAGGKKSVIKTKKGNDTITMTDGSYCAVYGDENNDSITVEAKVFGAAVFGGAGNDRITVNSTKTYKDKYKGVNEGKTFTQISYIGTYVDAGSGNDTIVVNAGTGHSIYSGTGKDRVTIGKKAQAYVDAGAGNDIITVKSATQGKYVFNGKTRYSGTTVLAGKGNDTITITAGKGHTAFTGSGNDAVVIKGGNNGTITYGSGNNYFTITGGSGYTIQSDFIYDKNDFDPTTDYYANSTKWKSTVSISGGSKNSINCGNGDDTVVIKGGTDNYVSVSDGNDYVEVTGGTNNSVSMSPVLPGTEIRKATVYIKGGKGTSVFSGNGKSSTIYVQGGTGTSVFTGEGKNSRIYVQGGSFKRIEAEGGTVSLSSKVKYGKDASIISRNNGDTNRWDGDSPVNYKVAWNDTMNLSFGGNSASNTDKLTITGVKCDDLMGSTEFTNYAEVFTVFGKNGGKITLTKSKGGWDFSSIKVGSEVFNSMSAFVSALAEFDSAAVGLNNNYASGSVFKSGSKTPLLATSSTVK